MDTNEKVKAGRKILSVMSEGGKEMVVDRIVRHPLRSVAIGAAVGCAAGYLMKKKRDNGSSKKD